MQHIHFVGIGGAGMSGLAEIALTRGSKVSGSDIQDSQKLRELKKLGAEIHIGHHKGNISPNIDIIVFTSAVKSSNNPELEEAERLGIRAVRRAEFLGELTASMQTIAVAGTHGKTTTTSMIAHILLEAGLDPMVSVGASVFELGGKNAHSGSGSLAVVEADEYDRSFWSLKPYIAILTTLEAEHLDIYKDLADLQDAFVQFVNNGAEQNGIVVVNIDEPAIRSILSRFHKRIVTFGVRSEEAKYRAVNIQLEGLGSITNITRGGENIGILELSIPGEHNIKNALAAIATAESLAIPFDIAAKALMTFQGAERRAQVIGETNGILVIDDYAHHPTEVEATLTALHTGYPGRRIVVAFQPHTFTRTRDFAKDFGSVFARLADVLYLADVYPARELPIAGISSELIAKAAKKEGLEHLTTISDLGGLPALIAGDVSRGDIVITLGAGSITEQAPKILKAISQRANRVSPKKNSKLKTAIV